MLARASELRMLDVINVTDGRRLGNVYDLDLDPETGRIRALVVPAAKPSWFIFVRSGPDIEIPWESIVKIGVDVILVRLIDEAGSRLTRKEERLL